MLDESSLPKLPHLYSALEKWALETSGLRQDSSWSLRALPRSPAMFLHPG